jgi:chromosome segregation ATPase
MSIVQNLQEILADVQLMENENESARQTIRTLENQLHACKVEIDDLQRLINTLKGQQKESETELKELRDIITTIRRYV